MKRYSKIKINETGRLYIGSAVRVLQMCKVHDTGIVKRPPVPVGGRRKLRTEKLHQLRLYLQPVHGKNGAEKQRQNDKFHRNLNLIPSRL